MKKRSCAFLLAALFLLLSGCGKKGAPIHVGDGTAAPVPVSSDAAPEADDRATDGSSHMTAQEKDPDEPTVFTLFGSGGKAKFTVVRSADADRDTVACAQALVKALAQKTGKSFMLRDDAASDPDPDALELLVGTTNRPESAESALLFEEALVPGEERDLKSYGGYLMTLVGNKICFHASDGRSMMKAIDDFTEEWVGRGTITVPAGGSASGVREPTEVTELTADTRPAVIAAQNPTEDVVIADVVATDAAYGADPMGVKDSTASIRKALEACSAAGGGTVWLPAGKYLVTGRVEIPAFVTLRGEAPLEEPKSAADYGTIIVAKPKSGEETSDALFELRGSCGAIGLTVWYPEQSLDDPKPYPYTFYITGNGRGGYMLQTVKDVLVVNGWVGIGACVTENNAHEQTTIENFRGTFLRHAVMSCNEADVGTWRSVRVSPSYWADSLFAGAPDRGKLAAYTRKNAEGLVLGDLEWDQFADITVEDCKVGIHTVEGTRVTFNGEMADVTVRRCSVGLLIDDMDTRWGMNLARSAFEDCERPIVNNVRAFVKLTDVTFPEDGTNEGTIREGSGDLSDCAPDYGRSYKKPAARVYTAKFRAENSFDISGDLQETLDAAGKTGGVVYLPAGKYRLDHPVTVPSGVELRGASSAATRGQNGCSDGTLISSVYGMGMPETETALITLSENAGVNGIRFVYPENGPAKNASTPYVIRGAGSGVYCVNCSIAAAGSGVDFGGCDGHFIKKVTACCYDHGIRAGGKDGYIEGCLQNATVMMRHGLDFLTDWIPEGQVFEKLFPILRSRSVFLTLDGADGEQVLNYFAYGVKTVLEAKDAKNVLVVNLGGDNIGDKAPLIRAESSALTVVNMQRYNGVLFETDGDCDLSLYNPLSIGNAREKNRIHNEEDAG